MYDRNTRRATVASEFRYLIPAIHYVLVFVEAKTYNHKLNTCYLYMMIEYDFDCQDKVQRALCPSPLLLFHLVVRWAPSRGERRVSSLPALSSIRCKGKSGLV